MSALIIEAEADEKSTQNVSKSTKKRRPRKQKKVDIPPTKEEIDRRKKFGNIVHKKVALIPSSNWKNFIEQKLHLVKEAVPNNIGLQENKNYYKGQFRKNRKNVVEANKKVEIVTVDLDESEHVSTSVSAVSNPTFEHTKSSKHGPRPKPIVRENRKNLMEGHASTSVSVVSNPTFQHTKSFKHGAKPSVESTEPSASGAMEQKLTRYIGIDCEMVGVDDDDGRDNMLARVSLVNKFGECIYDKFVKPQEDIIDYRTHVSGVRPIDLKNAECFETVQKEVAAIIKRRILVGHGLRNDLKVLYLSHPKRCIRDTSKYEQFRLINKGRTPSLKMLAATILGVTIQEGEHNPVIDARAAMQLFMMYKKEWEAELRTGRGTWSKSSRRRPRVQAAK